jgi:hypothetical protein
MSKVEVHKSKFTADEFELALQATGGYVEGYNEGYSKCEEAIETIIDASGVIVDTEATITDKVAQLADKAEFDKFIYEASLLKENCQHEFRHWTGKKLPKTNYINAVHFNFFASESAIETVDYYLDWQQGEQLVSAFGDTPNLKTMVGVNTSHATTVASMFNRSGIEHIQMPFDFSRISNAADMSAFTTATSLVEVRIVPETWKWGTTVASGVLSDESIQSIINGLMTVTTAQTLKLHTNVVAKLTDEQLIQIADKNWNIG